MPISFATALSTVVLTMAATLTGTALADSPSVQRVTFTNFNIRYYGLDGSHDGRAGADYRNQKIRDFLAANDLKTDVLTFQEIVDVPALKREIAGNDYQCESYQHNDARHQHVVVCVKHPLRLEIASDDDNYAFEDVALDRLRPAVHGIVTLPDGTPFAHVVSVHLKAQPDQSSTRLRQAELLHRHFATHTDDVPFVVLGDFNTFEDDDVRIGEALDLPQIVTPFPYTYRDPRYGGSKLDRAYASPELVLVGQPRSAGPCNDTPGDDATIRAYHRDVSDHCPVSFTLKRR